MEGYWLKDIYLHLLEEINSVYLLHRMVSIVKDGIFYSWRMQKVDIKFSPQTYNYVK